MEALVGQVAVQNLGTILIIQPLTDWAAEWLFDNVEDFHPVAHANGIFCEPRYARDILDGMLAAWLGEGQTVSP